MDTATATDIWVAEAAATTTAGAEAADIITAGVTIVISDFAFVNHCPGESEVRYSELTAPQARSGRRPSDHGFKVKINAQDQCQRWPGHFPDQVIPPPSIACLASSTAFSAVSASAEVVASSSTEGGTATRIFLPFSLRMVARHLSVSRWKASIT